MRLLTGIFKTKNKNGVPDTSDYRYVCKCDGIMNITEIHIGSCFHATVSEDVDDVIVLVDQKYKNNLIITLSDERQDPSYNKGKLTVNMSGTTVFTGRETAQVILPKSKLNLYRLELSGSANMTGGHFNAIAACIVTSGSSHYKGTVETGHLTVHTSGSSDIEIDGNGYSATVESSGSSDVYMHKFNTETAKVTASGASVVKVKTSSFITAKASGTSDIVFFGKPSGRDVKASGTATITQEQ